jgi:hypothetical protein
MRRPPRKSSLGSGGGPALRIANPAPEEDAFIQAALRELLAS